ncbi:MAG: 3-deoxy-manno-octulosonate cytidylyltransferase [Granulosicoccaceae bacterium]
MRSPLPNYRVVIPARYASSRFPAKVLHPINGVPMVIRVANRAQQSGATSVVIATDHADIEALCLEHKLDVEMTSVNHPSGTDRIREVAIQREWSDETIIVGLQGDEPATPSAHLDLLATNLAQRPEANMATLCTRLLTREDYLNPDRVKVVFNQQGYAMYFSRSPIPALRACNSELPLSYLHVGLYAYRCDYLKTYGNLQAPLLEQTEQLEQLRVLYNGGKIHVAEVDASEAIGVDRLEDVARVEQYIQSNAEGR